MSEFTDRDGSTIHPLGWQGHAIDFEVYATASGFKANGYDEDVLVEVVEAKSRRVLRRRMKRAAKRHGMSYTVLG